MNKHRRKHTAEFKARVALEAVSRKTGYDKNVAAAHENFTAGRFDMAGAFLQSLRNFNRI